jgi:dipeptidyl-peptidase-4
MVVLAADLGTGKTTPLLTEKDPAWVNIDPDVPYFLPRRAGFLWTSDRPSGAQLEHRDLDGRLKRVLVPATFGYLGGRGARGLGLASDGQVVYFRGGNDPTQAHLFRVGLLGGAPVPVSADPGVHGAVWADRFAYFVDQVSSPGEMPRAIVRRADGTRVAELPSTAAAPPFVPTTEILTVKVDDKTFPCAVTRPRTGGAQRRYPVLLEVYGGPGHTMVSRQMARYLKSQWMADQGFVVVSLDGRGTPGRGRDWERAIRGSFGEVPLADQVAGLKALGAKLPELDLSRVGITGWSFGGYMAALAVIRRPDVFKAAVAGAPVTLWEDYDTHYTERYLGLPEENVSGYKQSSVLTNAERLERPLFLIHGTADDNVFFSHTLKLSNALFKAGRPHELLPLSGFTHMVPDPDVRERLEERIVRFFQKHL